MCRLCLCAFMPMTEERKKKRLCNLNYREEYVTACLLKRMCLGVVSHNLLTFPTSTFGTTETGPGANVVEQSEGRIHFWKVHSFAIQCKY